MHKLILVSQSPRRKELLQKAGFDFRTDTVKVSEIIDENLNLEAAIQTLARDKCEAYLQQHKALENQKILLLTADTVVVFQSQVLGKPESPEQAKEFLGRMSGSWHSVKTGICFWDGLNQSFFTNIDSTEVLFRSLDPQEIADYVASGEPMDKAGAYGIQGEGGRLVKEYRGSWSNVVGLPMELLEKSLQENGWDIERKRV